MTAQEELTLIETAISEVLQYGQSLSVLGRTVTRANLKDLQERHSYLSHIVARISRTTGSVVYGVPYG